MSQCYVAFDAVLTVPTRSITLCRLSAQTARSAKVEYMAFFA